MTALRYAPLAALALLAACAKAPPPDPGKAESYAIRLAVTPAEGAAEQRIALPASALAALQSADIADVRLFDGAGRALPLALGTARISEQQTGAEVPVYPVMGSGTPATAGVALTIGADNVARISGVAGPAGADHPVAALLDTRRVMDPVIAVTLDADLPLQQPVTLALESSADLKNWEPLGEKVLFRTDAGGAQLEAGRIALTGAVLKDRYLRATWGEAKGVAVRGARVVTAKTGAPPRVAVAATGPKLAGPREVTFALPISGPLAALRIDPSDGEGVLPVQLAARDNPEMQWTPLAAATLRKPGSPGNVIELGGGARPEYRVSADERTPGFAAPPKVELLFDPVELVAQFDAKPPYTLAAGLKGAPSTLLALGDIAPNGADKLASAKIEAGSAPTIEIGAASTGGTFGGKKTLLWFVLIAGVAVLGFAVVKLMRGQGDTSTQ